MFKIAQKKIDDYESELQPYENCVVGQELKATELVRKLINQKLKLYEQMFVLVGNTLKILMLNYKLNVPVYRRLFHPILICVFGIFQNIVALFKIWLKKRYHKTSGRLLKV